MVSQFHSIVITKWLLPYIGAATKVTKLLKYLFKLNKRTAKEYFTEQLVGAGLTVTAIFQKSAH